MGNIQSTKHTSGLQEGESHDDLDRREVDGRVFQAHWESADGVEEDDMEIIVNRLDNKCMPDAVTLPLMKHYAKKDPILAKVGPVPKQAV